MLDVGPNVLDQKIAHLIVHVLEINVKILVQVLKKFLRGLLLLLCIRYLVLKTNNYVLGTCGIRATCRVVNHVAQCTCEPGYEGDPFAVCRQIVQPIERKLSLLFRLFTN